MRSCFSMRRWFGVKLCSQNSFCKVLFISMFLFCPCKYSCEKTRITLYTILDKTVEKIVYVDSIFLKIVAVPVLPSPPSPESNVVVYSRESLIPGRLWEATLNRGKGFSFRKGVVLEIVLLRRKVDMMGKTFSSSFVWDCSFSGHRPAQRECARTGLRSHARCHPYPSPQLVKAGHATGVYDPYSF